MARPCKDFVAAYEFATKTATSIDQMKSAKERIWFDYFNPNGAYSIFKGSYDKIFDYVDKGWLKSGALLAYSGDYYIDNLRKLIHRKSPPNKFDSRYYGNKLVELHHKIEKVLTDAHGR